MGASLGESQKRVLFNPKNPGVDPASLARVQSSLKSIRVNPLRNVQVLAWETSALRASTTLQPNRCQRRGFAGARVS